MCRPCASAGTPDAPSAPHFIRLAIRLTITYICTRIIRGGLITLDYGCHLNNDNKLLLLRLITLEYATGTQHFPISSFRTIIPISSRTSPMAVGLVAGGAPSRMASVKRKETTVQGARGQVRRSRSSHALREACGSYEIRLMALGAVLDSVRQGRFDGKHGRSRALATMIATRTAVADPMATSDARDMKPTVRRRIGPIVDTDVFCFSNHGAMDRTLARPR